jgi:hypothetical protein
MNATVTKISKGDKLSITMTTSGAEILEVVGAVRNKRTHVQYVYLATAKAVAAIRTGEVTAEFCVLTGLYGVRKLDIQYVYKLMACGLAVLA